MALPNSKHRVTARRLSTIMDTLWTKIRNKFKTKVDKVPGKGLSTNDFTNGYKTKLDTLDSKLAKKMDKTTAWTAGQLTVFDNTGSLVNSGKKPSDIFTVTQAQGKADKVSGAMNGHLAGLDSSGNLTDAGITITQQDIDNWNAMEHLGGFKIVPLTTTEPYVPDVQDPDNTLIYLTKEEGSGKTDPYTEWIYITEPEAGENNWQIIGEASIDLDDYYTKDEADGRFATTAQGAKADTAYQKPSGGIPKSDLAQGVQDSLDLADSSYQLPSTGVPKTDLAQGVQDSLDAADTAYQKPTTGIPSADLDQTVQNSLGLADTAVQDNNYVHTDNNYTTTEKTKLSGVEDGAQENVIEEIQVNGTAVSPVNKSVNIVVPAQAQSDWNESDSTDPAYIQNKPDLTVYYQKPSTGIPYNDLASTVQASLDKADTAIQEHQDISGKADKVSGATAGNLAALDANGNLVDSTVVAANTVQDASYVHTDNNYTTAEKNKLSGIEDNAEVNIIETVKVNGTALVPDSDRAVDITVPAAGDGKLKIKLGSASVSETGFTANASSDTTVEIPNATASVDGLMSKEDKALVHTHANQQVLDDTTASYTTEEQAKLSGIETGAQVNIIESISVNGTAVSPDANKNVALTVPVASDNSPAMDGTASAGVSDDYSRADHVHPSDTSKQDVLQFDGTYDASTNKVATVSTVTDAVADKVTKPSTAVTGDLVCFDANKDLVDAGKSINDFVMDVSYDGSTKKFTKTDTSGTSDIVTDAALKEDMGLSCFHEMGDSYIAVGKYAVLKTEVDTAGYYSVDIDTFANDSCPTPESIRICVYSNGSPLAVGTTNKFTAVVTKSGNTYIEPKVLVEETDATHYTLYVALYDNQGNLTNPEGLWCIRRDTQYNTGTIEHTLYATYTLTSATDCNWNTEDIVDTGDIADVTSKADKVVPAAANNFAALNSSGNLADSGYSSSSFATAAQGATADSAVQEVKLGTTELTKDANNKVTIPIASTTDTGVTTLQDSIDNTTTTAVTPHAVKDAIDTLEAKVNARAVFMTAQEWATQSQLPGDPSKVYYVAVGSGTDKYDVYVWKTAANTYELVDQATISLDGYWHNGPTQSGSGNVVTDITLGADGVPVVTKSNFVVVPTPTVANSVLFFDGTNISWVTLGSHTFND